MLRILSLFTLLTLGLTLQAQSTLKIISPGSIAGDYAIIKALFGNGYVDTLRGELILANNGSGSSLACDTIINDVKNKIVVIDRGDCDFVVKARKAQNAGAKALIICNNRDNFVIFPMGPLNPSIQIPSFMISQTDGNKIKNAITGAQASIYFFDPGNEPLLYHEMFNSGKGAWTSVGLSNAKDTFTWSPNGITRGAFGSFRLDAPTADNGAMIYDADYLTTSGDTTKIPDNPNNAPIHAGELISPIINCSSFNSVSLKFHQLYAGEFSTTSVAYSTDGGSTWSDPIEVNEKLSAGSVTARGSYIKLELPQLANKPQVRIKFIFEGDWYFWVIDDIKLLGKAQLDIAINENQYFFPFNYVTPVSQISTDTSTFFAKLSNLGSLNAGQIVLKVAILNGDGLFLHRDSLVINNLNAGIQDSTFFLPKIYVPGKLPLGVYTLVYSIDSPLSSLKDSDPSNNLRFQEFVVSESIFSKDDGENITRGRRGLDDGNYFYGNIYSTSTDWNANDKFSASKVEFAVFMDDQEGNLTGKTATVYLLEVSANVGPDFGNFDDSKTFLNHPQLKVVGVGIHEFKGGQFEFATTTLQDVVNFNENVVLKKGTRYVVGVSYADASSKIYHLIDQDINYYQVANLYFNSNQWFSPSDVPLIRLNLSISTLVDVNALPDYTLQLMPNPATNSIRAQVKFEKATNANFVIADINGRVLQLQSQRGVLNDSFEFDVRNFTPGTYLMRISTDEGTRTKKFIVQR